MWSHCERKREVVEKAAEDMYIQNTKIASV